MLKKEQGKTFLLVLVLTLSAFTFINTTTSIYVNPGDSIVYQIDSPLENYTWSIPYNVSKIIISDNYVCFNTTGFNITSTTAINITINHISSNTYNPPSIDCELINFTVSNNPGATWFNISGFYPNQDFNVTKDGVNCNYTSANATGVVSFYASAPNLGVYVIRGNGTAYNPIVTTTLLPTQITSYSVILNGYLDYDGGEDCTVWFNWWNTSTPFAFNTTNQTKSTGDYFNATLSYADDSYHYYRVMTVGSSYVDTSLVNFTILVNVSSDISSKCDGGNSIRFLDVGNTTEYSYEIEGVWDNNSHNYVWVKIPYISSSIDTCFIMRYNNTETTDNQSSADAWDDNYMAVWHMYNLSDSTGNSMNITNHGADTNTSGKVGSCYRFVESNSDYMEVPYGFLDYFPVSNELTIELWANHTSDTGSNQFYLSKNNIDGADRFYLARRTSTDLYDLMVETGNQGNDYCTFSTASSDGFWHRQVALIHEGNQLQTYRNLTSKTGDTIGYFAGGTADDFKIGRWYTDAYHMDGLIDEIRISDVLRNQSWLNASYHTQNQTTGFLTTGIEVANSLVDAGTLYIYMASANNSNTTAYGEYEPFLTLPNVPNTVSGDDGITLINLSWVKGSGANNTYIERNLTGVTSWSMGEGLWIYNGTGTYYVDENLAMTTTYYYQLWSSINWTYNGTNYHQFSGGYASFNAITTQIDPPYNGSSDYDTNNQRINLTWTRGNNSDREIVVQNNNSYPTTPTDGWVRQNSSNTYFNGSITYSAYFTIWSYNSTAKLYSDTGLNMPWGAIKMQCYDESNYTALTFSVLITNETLVTTYLEDITNGYLVDLNDIPFGEDTIFYVSSDDYNSRTYYYDLEVNTFYNFSFFLPYALVDEDDPDYDPDNVTYSHLYRFIVNNEIGYPLEDAKIEALLYLNETGEWETTSISYTGANGQSDIYLLAGQGILYNMRISLDGYDTQINEFTPDPDYYGVYYPTTYVLVRTAVDIPDIVTGFDIIDWDAYYISGDNTTMYISYEDSTGNTTAGEISIYRNGTDFVYSYSFTSSSFDITWTLGNHSLYDYNVLLNISGHPDITGGYFNDTRIVSRYETPHEHKINTAWALEVDFVEILGENPMGWLNLVIFFFGIFILVSLGRQWAGVGIIALGGILFVFELIIGLPGFTLLQLTVIPFFLLYGVLAQIAKGKKDVKI